MPKMHDYLQIVYIDAREIEKMQTMTWHMKISQTKDRLVYIQLKPGILIVD